MDTQAQRRYHQLKAKLDALQYCQPLTIESAALAERLLNDMLKATEAFNKLKKINEDLKSRAGAQNQNVSALPSDHCSKNRCARRTLA